LVWLISIASNCFADTCGRILTKIDAPLPLQTSDQLQRNEKASSIGDTSGATHYLFALMISIASSSVSAEMIVKTGPKISFLLLSVTASVYNLRNGENALVCLHCRHALEHRRSNEVPIGVSWHANTPAIKEDLAAFFLDTTDERLDAFLGLRRDDRATMCR
jgi:hypothetical protein